MTGFFPPDAEGFTPAGTAIRQGFYDHWDLMLEYWLEDNQSFVQGRTPGHRGADDLLAMEQSLCQRSFYREVDETVAVLPNRAPAPDFYFR